MIHWALFNSLPLEQKGELIYKKGKVVSRVHTEGHFIALYRVEDFYVEFRFHGASGKVESITAISQAWLRPFLSQVWTNAIHTLIEQRGEQLWLLPEQSTCGKLAKDFLIKRCAN